MALDTFICGSCQLTFNDIEQFVIHKKDCNVNLLLPADQQEAQDDENVDNKDFEHLVVSTEGLLHTLTNFGHQMLSINRPVVLANQTE